MADIDIKEPEDYKFYFHTSREGNVWLDGKGKPIPLDQPLVNHVDSISPIELWNSRCTRKSIHPKDTVPRKAGAYNSTTVDKDIPHFNTPCYPIMETTIKMPLSDGLSSEDTIVQDIMADPNINQNLLQAVINTLSLRINAMQSAQAIPTLGKIDSSGFDHQRSGLRGQAPPTRSSSPFDHQGSAVEGSDSNSSQSNNQPQHPPLTLELKKLKAEFKERHRINTECIKQNLSM